MVTLQSLWLPIIVSVALVFIASSIIWMALPWHKGDYKKAPNEDALLNVVRSGGLTAGQYGFPMPSEPCNWKEEGFKEKYAKGPWGVLLVQKSGVNMGVNLALWTLYLLIVSVFTAYIATHALHSGEKYLRVFQVCGAAAAMSYAVGAMPASIWGGRPWKATGKDMVDGLLYALLTAGVFGWLWPHGAQIPAM